ncbi:MAG: site-2 protease family protein [Timaviella obliquedivisa GSE-PSE-MK23-08B]|jgi:membrane-associated protease RseP (regulator of RpoE activity)|nr:site-2 protease family protein [Timaviella obliquedivisa GSE-PSE-MK23-08B]
MITVLILLVALGILGWGLYRAQPMGKLGLLAWLQSVVLMLPWLLFFGLSAAGIYMNLAAVLFLLVASTVVYIVLGRQLRAIASQSPTDSSASPDVSKISIEPAPVLQTPSPELAEAIAMPAEDVQLVRGIFGIDTFFATETIPYQDGVIFRGNLRGDPHASYEQLSAMLQTRLGDRYRLFLVEGEDRKPVVVVLPSSNDPKPTTLTQALLAGVLGLATIASSLETAGILKGFDFFNQTERYLEVLPISAGILLILAAYELGRRWAARQQQVRLSPPFFIPAIQIGSFGALTRFQSLLPNRSALFDIAFSGPAAGGLLALGMLVAGLVLSTPTSLFQIPAEFFQGSILVGTLARVVLGSALQQPVVSIHPLVVIGWLGLVMTAINLMPAGQLDGGRIVQSIYGRKTAGRTTVATLIVLGIVTLANPLALYWAIVILVLQRNLERPALNELVEPNDTRAALGLLVLFLMAATLLPLTPGLAGRLGIGG